MDGGVGLVNKIDDYGIYYGFMNTSSHSMDQQYRAGPLAGFVIGNDSLKFQVDCGLDFGLEYYGYTEILEGKIQYQIDRENAVQIYFEKKDQTRWGLSYIFYW